MGLDKALAGKLNTGLRRSKPLVRRAEKKSCMASGCARSTEVQPQSPVTQGHDSSNLTAFTVDKPNYATD